MVQQCALWSREGEFGDGKCDVWHGRTVGPSCHLKAIEFGTSIPGPRISDLPISFPVDRSSRAHSRFKCKSRRDSSPTF